MRALLLSTAGGRDRSVLRSLPYLIVTFRLALVRYRKGAANRRLIQAAVDAAARFWPRRTRGLATV
jgi:hypothetical protein